MNLLTRRFPRQRLYRSDPLARLLPPTSTWNDPLFRTDARSIKWAGSWAILRRRMFRWGVQMLIVMALGLLVLATCRIPTLIVTYTGGYSYYTLLSLLGEFLAFAFVASVGLNILLDFVGISGALGTISSDFNLRRSDLIRLSLLRPTQIIASKHTLAQVRVLRMTFRIMWGRLWVVVVAAALALWAWLETLSRGTGTVVPDPVLVFSGIVVGALSVFTFIMEPFWRVKAVTALGVALSARTMHGASATLNAGFSLISFWIGQGTVIGVLLFVLQISFAFYTSDPWMVFILLLTFWALITAAIYGFYALIVKNSLYQAAYRLATLDN